MSLMNGVDSEEIIGEAIGKEHLMPSLIKIASRKENGYRFDLKQLLELFWRTPSTLSKQTCTSNRIII